MVYTNIYSKLHSKEKAKEFIGYYKSCYDKYEHTGLDYKLAFLLYKDKRKVEHKSAIRWYGIVGPGGTGKTTLAKNICYFFDHNFNSSAITTEIKDAVKMMINTPITGAFKSILIDEPDFEIHANSKTGKAIRNVFGKVRQQQVYMVFCATDLIDIPPFIFRKLDTIIMTKQLGEGIMVRNEVQKNFTPVTDLREIYLQKNYGVFFNAIKTGIGMRINTYNFTPLSAEEEAIYKKNKEQDLRDTQVKCYKMLNNDKEMNRDNAERYEKIKQMLAEGKKKKEIALHFNISYVRINQILREYSDRKIEK